LVIDYFEKPVGKENYHRQEKQLQIIKLVYFFNSGKV
jgi:hypothetical protein